ncbi:MAG: hypothetical protein ACLGI9_01670 [Thermoanaerobaculia bacterium]
MSRSKLLRTLCILTAIFILALPVAAQPRGEVRTATLMDRLVSVLWERLASPLASLWKNAETTADTTGDAVDSTGSTTPDDLTDGRAHIDPNG